MTIQELREARNKAWQGAKAFVESKRDKDGLLSKEDAEAYAKMEQKIKDYSAEIERMEQMEALENELNKPVNTPILTNPQQTGGGEKLRPAGRPMNTVRVCWRRSAAISSRCPMSCRKAWMRTAVTLCRRNTTAV